MHTRKMNLLQLIIISMALFVFPSKGKVDPKTFFIKYGYIKPAPNNTVGPQMFNEAIMKFQKFTGLIETGIINKQVEQLMETSRCGNLDYFNGMPGFTSVPATNKQHFTWAVKHYSNSSKLTRGTQLDILIKAFKRWSQETTLSFTMIPNHSSADIKISFEKLNHGDNNPFDYRGYIYGHASYENSGKFEGNAHFDEDELWTVSSNDGIDFEFAAVHELGHVLGLPHSSNDKSVMRPFYKGYEKDFSLGTDDIKDIQRIHGSSSTMPTTTSTTTKRTTTKRTTPKATASHQVISLLIPVLCLMTYVDLVP